MIFLLLLLLLLLLLPSMHSRILLCETSKEGAPTKEEAKDLLQTARGDDLLQQETGWIALAQASNDAAGFEARWRMAGGHDGSNSSTAASEKSDKRKRKSNPSEDEASLKPYECRFCPMKFAKSQALGGHMNRHRQEREREQLIHARQLVMQQDFPPLMMPVQNICSPPLAKFQQPQLQRPSESPLKYNSRTTAPVASAFTGTQSSPYVSSALPSSQLGYGMRNMMQQPNRIPLNSGQDMLGMSFERNMHSSAFPFDTSAVQMSPYGLQMYGFQNQRQPSQSPDAGSAGGPERRTNVSPALLSNASSLHFGTSDVTPLLQTAGIQPEESQQFNNLIPIGGFQLMTQNSRSFYPYPAEGIRSSTPDAFPDFNTASGNHLEGLSWMFGNQKTATAACPLSNKGFNHALGHETVINNTGFAGQSRTISGQLSMPSSLSDPGGRIRDVTATGTSTLHFGIDYGHGATEMESKHSQESKISR